MSTDIAVIEPAEAEPALVTLFGTQDPKATLARMAETAAALADVVRSRRLAVRIQGREHLTIEAWQTLGGLLGVYGVVEWTKPNENGDGYVARAIAKTLDGRIVGAAEAECTRAERNWQHKDAFMLRSMAQTRAVSRALKAPLGQIVTLAGYQVGEP
jgi:hypothetical protein